MIRAIFMTNGDRVLVPSSWTVFTVRDRRFRQHTPGVIEVKTGAYWNRKHATPPVTHRRQRSPESIARSEMAAAQRAVIAQVGR